MLVGPIEDDLQIDHLCRNHACCNPDHLEPVPADLLGDELIRRMVEVWLTTPFEAGRHARRVQKMMAAEKHLCPDGEKVPMAGEPAPPAKSKTKPK